MQEMRNKIWQVTGLRPHWTLNIREEGFQQRWLAIDRALFRTGRAMGWGETECVRRK